MKMSFPRYLSLFLVILCFGSCQENDAVLNKNLVVEGYLYVGQPVNDIRLTRLVPLGNTINTPTPINNAQVVIQHNGQDFELIPSPGDSGYYHYPGDDLRIVVGGMYTLKIQHEGQTITSQTQAPDKPVGLALSKTSLNIAPIRSFLDIGNRQTEDLDINWSNPAQSFHYLTIRNIEASPDPIDLNNILNAGSFAFPADPVRSANTRLVGAFLTDYGMHQVVLFRINAEYVNLFNSANQDSRNLNEPTTNINNGLGIFTCVNADTTSFEVIHP